MVGCSQKNNELEEHFFGNAQYTLSSPCEPAIPVTAQKIVLPE